ncbi:MAG TPA: ROK family protein [Polyangiales bacterium]|nr:ROK family protein [Polyangiales bacterium]
MASARTLVGAIELGGTKALCAVGSSARAVIETRIPTTTPGQTLSAIETFFAPYRHELIALGIAAFGPLELNAGPKFGSLLRTPKVGWEGTPLASRLSQYLSVPVRIDTDVNAAAVAEQRLGAGRGANPCVYITVGTGIGVGVTMNGATLHGLLHPELGHLQAPALDDFAGVCPFHGRCLEGVASAPALQARLGMPPDRISAADPIWDLEARYLAHLLTACVLAYAPQRIVLGGGVFERPGLLERVRPQLLKELAGYIPRSELTEAGITDYVRRPHFGQRAGLIGAFLLGEDAVAS